MKNFYFIIFLLLISSIATGAQIVRIDATPSRAIVFDPDKALGSSIDILMADQIEKIYSKEIIKESLSAGWADHISTKYRTLDWSVALESQWKME